MCCWKRRSSEFYSTGAKILALTLAHIKPRWSLGPSATNMSLFVWSSAIRWKWTTHIVASWPAESSTSSPSFGYGNESSKSEFVILKMQWPWAKLQFMVWGSRGSRGSGAPGAPETLKLPVDRRSEMVCKRQWNSYFRYLHCQYYGYQMSVMMWTLWRALDSFQHHSGKWIIIELQHGWRV